MECHNRNVIISKKIDSNYKIQFKQSQSNIPNDNIVIEYEINLDELQKPEIKIMSHPLYENGYILYTTFSTYYKVKEKLIKEIETKNKKVDEATNLLLNLDLNKK